MAAFSENSDRMSMEPLSPELALVDPELAARARSALPAPALRVQVQPRSATMPPSSPAPASRSYPIWARVTGALWVLVLGVLIGGAAIPHAQDRPRVVPSNEDFAFCRAPAPSEPTQPGR